MRTETNILVIDDDYISWKTLQALFCAEPYQLFYESNGPDGVRRARELLPDVILLDVMMPGMDGFEVCRQLRSDPVLSNVSIIMVTALDDRHSRLEGLNAGADEFLNKPFDSVELSLRVKTVASLNRYRRLLEQKMVIERLNHELLNAYDATIEGWSRALDLRDKETEGHTLRVTEITLHMARCCGLSNELLVHVRRGALLHDIGKMGVPDSILLKPNPLTPEEWEIMRKHPVFAYEMLSPIEYLRPALDIPYCHHERWDGSGYPRGLSGENIPLSARIFAVIDIWDALRSDRPYRPAWAAPDVISYIQSISNHHLDPEIVRVFMQELPRLEQIAAGQARSSAFFHAS